MSSIVDKIAEDDSPRPSGGIIYTPPTRRMPDEARTMIGLPPIEKALASQRQVAGTHYKAMGVEPWDVVDTWPIEQRIGAYRHGALKYLMRMGSKDENAQEIAKGVHYMEKLLEVLKESSNG